MTTVPAIVVSKTSEDANRAAAGFLARYGGPTRRAYGCDLRAWFASMRSRPKLGAFIAQGAAAGVTDHALACVLGLFGLRVSEACSINIEDLGLERGHRTLYLIGKGNKPTLIPLPPRVARAVDQAANGRLDGPLLLSRTGRRLDRFGATRIVRRLAKRPGSASASHLTPCATASSPPPSTPASRSETCRSQRAMPIPGRPLATTGPATISTATLPTSSRHSWPERHSDNRTTSGTACARCHGP